MTLSVIVPVYNADKFLCRCLDSLLKQWPEDRDDYEIICVNDGSTDCSGEILKEYLFRHSQRIKVIEQENKGLPAARNAGMEISQGEILAFCDADDWVYEGAYYLMYSCAWDARTELLRFQSITLDQYMLKTWIEPDSLSCDVTYEGIALDFMSKTYVLPFVWTYFYRRAFLVNNHILTKDVAMVEDVIFNLDVFVLNPYLKVVDTKAYRYNVSDTQITKSRNNTVMRRSIEGYMFLFKTAKQYSLSNPIAKDSIYFCMNQIVGSCVSRLLCTDYCKKEFDSWKQTMKQLDLIPLRAHSNIAKIINFATINYYGFSLFRMIYKAIFIPFILPRLRRN